MSTEMTGAPAISSCPLLSGVDAGAHKNSAGPRDRLVLSKHTRSDLFRCFLMSSV